MTDPMGQAVTITIISSQQVLLFGLKKLLESCETLRILVHPYHRLTSEALSLEDRPDIFILDMETTRDSVGAIKQMREMTPQSKILLLSGFEDRERLRETVDYGVDGVILKIQPPTVVLAAIQALHCPLRHHALVEQMGQNGVRSAPLRKGLSRTADTELKNAVWPDALTEREHEVIGLVRQGLSNKDIAYRLSISDSTVRHHLTSIFDKVGVPNRQKLLVHAHNVRSTPE